MGPLGKLRTQIDDTAAELRSGADDVSEAVDRAADAITVIGAVAIVALILAAYAVVKTTDLRPPL